jgi:positive regulator of sigma E activity
VTETGKVTGIEGDIITLRCKPGPACGGCSGAGCGSPGREVMACNTRHIPLKAGDEAEIFMPPVSGVFSALKVFGIPVLAFVLFYGIAGILAMWKESVCVPAGFAGLILASLVLYFAGRKNAVFPEILRVMEKDQAD